MGCTCQNFPISEIAQLNFGMFEFSRNLQKLSALCGRLEIKTHTDRNFKLKNLSIVREKIGETESSLHNLKKKIDLLTVDLISLFFYGTSVA